MRILRTLLFVATFGGIVPLAAQPAFSRQDAARFQTKLAQIEAFGASTRPPARGQTVQLSDTEVNAYLRYGEGVQIPVGITEPTLNALGSGRVSGRAVVDLDAVRTQQQRGWTDPLSWVSGKLPVTAHGTLSTQNGTGRFQLESAELAGVSIPKGVLQELLTYYSRTPETPNGINMDEPFKLPARIREIQVGQGSATIVQ